MNNTNTNSNISINIHRKHRSDSDDVDFEVTKRRRVNVTGQDIGATKSLVQLERSLSEVQLDAQNSGDIRTSTGNF